MPRRLYRDTRSNTFAWGNCGSDTLLSDYSLGDKVPGSGVGVYNKEETRFLCPLKPIKGEGLVKKETLDPKIWAAYEVGPTSGPRGQSSRRVGEYPRGLEP